ncbi:hypothetical protein [Bradyrhizobium neotropicale]|uniref:Lipoprotein n=1 Tax=Bradyrhizobium neotropicale TaxID=1497615 RepID=A0A176ZG37_9BRAD|nr:hypothetical protein [Bradyrhizobium neotropicale]OAF19641.1 hypothetical protein AXW67_36150 [Bradyrhizobium neotropicale]
MKYSGLGVAFLLLSGCTLLPLDQRAGGATIEFFKDSIECEIAAIAADPKYREFKLASWVVKTGLDMTLVDTVNADGKGTVPLTNPTLPTIFPGASINGKFTHNGHVDFATSIPKAIVKWSKLCQGPDPSESHLGLAGWIAATLDKIEPQNHGGLSYTVDVDVTASAGARFGFVFSIINTADSGFNYSREGVHHLVVTMSEPTPPPPSVIDVRVVGPVKISEEKDEDRSRSKGGPRVTSQPAPAGGGRVYPFRNPALEDPNLNRLL